mmetsp:Transcript_15085/g.27162  ORF Transcript_15085/g.27162 Transcript_15085/m.27162 type:complete len:348 (-) Transcript_15085:158-1201(-)|eukprot:CAMPEP_0197517008 /NCGR_PEP_ID=MMETSP1318-20131121/1984_1 /TAXON_ID=552666 /ORGANISM="Partenskyella glossopodia, Strain RCC365" /LENGTH=347 /DNA_ID=CAMNT_0043066235 /DNA_START=38 /DNA_END=1081 /DNA_ORIENTATION=+
MDSKQAKKIASFLEKFSAGSVDVAIVCGSGLSHLSSSLSEPVAVKYTDIDGWPMTTVNGHKAELVFGKLGGKKVVCMRGRFHTYEGYNIQRTALPIAVFKFLGVSTLIVTNAAGGINPTFDVGDMMVIEDHINLPGLAGKHPLVGENDSELGVRFPAMSDCYYKPLRNLALKVGSELGFGNMRRGTYVFVSGPTYESAAETKFLYAAGADAVGMSTIPETVVAHYCGLKVLGVSLITNKSILCPNDSNVATHEEVLAATSGENEKRMKKLISEIVRRYDPKAPVSEDEKKEQSSGVRPGTFAEKLDKLETKQKNLQMMFCGLATVLLTAVGVIGLAASHMKCPRNKK